MSAEFMKHNIEKAWQEAKQKESIVSKGNMRQFYHFMPQTGWMNDPNGLIYFKGKYHIFYQYNPYQPRWGNIYWGHAVSDDLFHWEYLPPALAPSEPYDTAPRGGCFSGSAIEHEGRLFLMYTGTSESAEGIRQTQCIAYSDDGVHFKKYEKNPVITAPKWVRSDCFRDPKLWKHNGMYYMVCGAGDGDRGMALLYRSSDMFHWSFFNVLAESRGEWGSMWECPDFYELGERYVLTFSPIGAGEHTAVYMTGDFDYNTGRFSPLVSKEIDWGMDYYAPQSFETPDGRRIVIGWANEWEWMPFYKDWGPTYKEGWCGFYSIPREVYMQQDGTLRFQPVKELSKLRKREYTISSFVATQEQKELIAGDGIAFELRMEINLNRTTAEKVVLYLRCGEKHKTVCVFDLKRGELCVDRNRSDGWSRGISRSVLFLKDKKRLDVHILSDQSSLEVFADCYQNNHSINIFAGKHQNQIKISAEGGNAVIDNYQSYSLRV